MTILILKNHVSNVLLRSRLIDHSLHVRTPTLNFVSYFYLPCQQKPLPRAKVWKPTPTCILERRAQVRSLYRTLLRLSNQFRYDVYSSFLKTSIRERFRFHRFLKADSKIYFLIREAEEVQNRLLKCLNGDVIMLKFLDDLAWGRIGRMKTVLNSIKQDPKSEFVAHKLVNDIRSAKSKSIDRHHSQAIPIDQHIYQPPKVGSSPRLLQSPTDKAILVRTSFLTAFVRFQGRPQPPWLSMMIHRIRDKNQRSLTLYKNLKEYLEMVRIEKEMVYQASGSLEADGYEEGLISAIEKLRFDFEQRREKYEDKVRSFAARNGQYIAMDNIVPIDDLKNNTNLEK